MTAVAKKAVFAPGTCEFLGAYLVRRGETCQDHADVVEDLLGQDYVEVEACPHTFLDKPRGIIVNDAGHAFRQVCQRCAEAATGQSHDVEFRLVGRPPLPAKVAAACGSNDTLKRLAAGGPDVDGNSFLADVARKFVQYGSLSDRQIAAVQSAFDRVDSRKASAAAGIAAPAGKTEVVGEVIGCKLHYGAYGTTQKITIKSDAGYKVWLTKPAEFDATTIVGKRVSVVATLVPSSNDPAFAFGKRPSKAKTL